MTSCVKIATEHINKVPEIQKLESVLNDANFYVIINVIVIFH